MTESTSNIDGLRKYYTVTENAKIFRLFCRKCGQGWQLDTSKGLHPGNVLKLLDHAHSHLQKKKYAASE
jgi:hypothetical protein